MSTAVPDQGNPTGGPRRPRRLQAMALALVLVLALAAAVLLGYRLAGPGTPSDTSPEAGFARDMQTHHNQAVQMALMLRDKGPEPTLAAVAYDIITSQQQQSGQMYAWLSMWRLPQTSTQPAMAWMAANPAVHDMGAMPTGAATAPGSGSMLLPDGRMPGMASPADLRTLQSSSGKDAETLFLKLMIQHHTAGIAMARAIQPLTDRPEVLTLAQAVVSAQAAEIDQMKTLLAAKGG